MKRILIGLLVSAISIIPAWAVEDNNPCQHKNMEFNRYIGSVTLSQTGSVDEQKGRCGAPVDVCALAKGVVSLTDTFKEELICSDCGEHTETQTPEGHSPKKVATHYLVGGDDPVTGAGTYRVSVGASCSCGACSLPSPIVITVTISHDYQEVEECDVSVTWYDQPGGPTPPEAIQNCTLTQSEARQQAGRLARVSGHCYTLKRCTSCEDEKSKTDHLSESTGASGGETAYNIYKRVKCEHYNDRKDYTITLRHNIGLKGGSQQGSCSFEGVPTEHSVQEQNVSVPVADTRTFNVAFNEKSHGNTKYTGYECSRCTLSRNFAEPLLVPHAPATELPPQTGSGELVDPQPQYPYQVKFNSVGETKVTFQHLCKTLSDRTLTHEGMTFEHIDVPGCSQSKAGEYEFAVKVMTVDKLAVTSEKGTAADTTLVLPELPDYEPEPAESVYVRAYKPETDDKPAQWETVLQATPTPAGEWPDGYPLWTRYPQYQGEAPDPLLLPVEDEPGKRLSHPSPGAYVIVARCGVNNKEVPGQEGLQPNPAHAKSLALYVVDPSSSVDFQPLPPGSWDAMLKASGNEKAKKGVVIASNGKTQPIRMILRVNRTGLKGRNATLKIKSKEKESYAIYKDKECTDIFMKPGKRSREQQVTLEELEDNPDTVELTLYFLPLLPDEEVAATLEYEDSSIDVEEPGEDKVMISGGCSSCVGDCIPLNGECGLGSVKVNFDLGPGRYGVPGGSVKVDSETLDYKLLGPDSFQVVAPATTEVKYNEDGYPVSADTGVYRTTFEYTVATVGEETEETKPIKFVSRVVIKTSGAEAELTLNYTVVDQLPKVTDFTVKNTVNGVVRNYRYECAEQSNSDFGEAVDVWSLTRWEGNNTAAAQTETVARKDAGDLRTEYRYTGPVSAPLIKEKQVKQKFADGEYEVIESRIGDAVTTYAYDVNRNLTSVTEPDGSSTTYAYNADGELVSTTEKVGGLTTVTTHTLTDNG
ncbi:hypothetical protein, partial [Victivallis vadensis]|uniref:hypothetical protein n=1 Tax=Victivallis vadensis TaxID=172901 RepID=UPI003AF9FF18